MHPHVDFSVLVDDLDNVKVETDIVVIMIDPAARH